MEAQLCEKEDIIVVGGGNSAGQAAVFLSQTARKVYMLVRSGGLSESMSRYLIQRIEENPAIELHYQTEIVGLEGGDHVERVTWQNKTAGRLLPMTFATCLLWPGRRREPNGCRTAWRWTTRDSF